jgi:hypothetical protein
MGVYGDIGARSTFVINASTSIKSLAIQNKITLTTKCQYIMMELQRITIPAL